MLRVSAAVCLSLVVFGQACREAENDTQDTSSADQSAPADLLADLTLDVAGPDGSGDTLEDGQDWLAPDADANFPDAQPDMQDLESIDGVQPPDTTDVTGDNGEETVTPAQYDIPGFQAAVADQNSEYIQGFLAWYSGPICDQQQCLVLSSVPFFGDVAIRGCFNGWQDGTIMAPVPQQQGYYYHVFPASAFQGKCEYRLYYDETWNDDLSNPYIAFSDLSINNAIYKTGHSRLARVRAIYSTALDNYRDVFVYLPADAFSNTNLKFPVMYMQDGFNVFANPMAPFGSWDVDVSMDKLISDGDVPPMIIVGIDTSDRLNEYLYCTLSANIGGTGIIVDPKLDGYLNFVAEELIPLIESRFPALSGRESRGMGGSSLGGISSMYMAWKRPDLFGKVASFSGSYWIGLDEDSVKGDGGVSFLTVLSETPPQPSHTGLKIYLDSGSSGGSGSVYEADARVYTDWVRNALIRYGWANRPEWDTDGDIFTPPADLAIDTQVSQVPTLYWSASTPALFANADEYLRPDLSLLHLVGEGHMHNEEAWRLRFPAAMKFLWN